MEKLLEQAKTLVTGLSVKDKDADERRINLDKREVRLDERKVELDNVQADLLQREINIKPIEDISKTQRETVQSKAEADLEWTKIRSEWDAIEVRKKSDQAEAAAARNDIKDKRELYDRGAKENAVTAAKLDEKVKKFNEATGRI